MLDEKDLQAIQRLIECSESRMMDRLAASESKMMDRLAASESKVRAYIESDILPRFDKLAAFLKPLVMSMLTDIDKLKKAQ